MTSIWNHFPNFRWRILFTIFILIFPASSIPFAIFALLATIFYNFSKAGLFIPDSRFHVFKGFKITSNLAFAGVWLFFVRYTLQILISILHYFCSCLEVIIGRHLSVGKLVYCFVPFFLEMMLLLLLKTFVIVLFLSFSRCLIVSTQILALSSSGQKPPAMFRKKNTMILLLLPSQQVLFSLQSTFTFHLPKNPH